MAAGTQKGVTLGGEGGRLPKLAVVTLRAFRRQMWVDGNRDIDGDADVDLDGVGDGDGDPVKVPRKNGGGGGGGRAGFRNNEWVGSGGGLEVWWFEKVVIGKWREGGGGREEEEDRGLERRAVRRGGCKMQKLRFSLASCRWSERLVKHNSNWIGCGWFPAILLGLALMPNLVYYVVPASVFDCFSSAYVI